MQPLTRVLSILVTAASFIAFTAMKVNAVGMPVAVPAPFPAPGNPSFPAPVPPMPSPIFPSPGGTGSALGGTGNAPGGAPGAPGGGTGGMSGSGIH